MGRITPTFRQLFEETISELKTELQSALIDLGHKNAFDLLLKEAWNPEQAAMGNSTLPTVCDKLNVMAAIHNRKLIAALVRELIEKDEIIEKLEERIVAIENQLQEIKRAPPNGNKDVFLMAHTTGWILDVSVERDRAIIWIKTSQGQILKLFDSYEPTFYILPKGAEIFQLLSHENSVRKVKWVNKFTDLFDRRMKRLICIYPEPVFYHKTLRKLEKDPRVAELFNTELSHLQDYLLTKLRIEPTSRVKVVYDDDKSHLRKITKLNDEDVLSPPPFSILHFEIEPSLDADDIILDIRVRKEEEEEILFEGEEGAILKEFCDYVQKEDPDILISTNKLLDHFVARMNTYGLDAGRENGTQGRVCLDGKSLHLPALIERARFGFLPLGLAARYGMNRLIDSRNCYELIQRGFVISSRAANKNHEPIRTLEEINSKDKGGMIFSPQVGLHENVVVLDYENEYANLILRHNLSYETEGHENQKKLPLVLENVLNRRIFFKNSQKSLSVNSTEWNWCEQRIDTLKNILVSLYGTSGSFWNRFANVEPSKK